MESGPDLRPILVAILVIVLVVAILALVAFFVLRWIALRIAERVAARAEEHLTAIGTRMTSTRISPERVARMLPDEERRRHLAQIDRIAWLMDRVIPLPVIGGVGLDALLGLFPVAGDLASLGISSLIIVRAAQLGAPPELLTRLVAVQCLDLLLGAVPFLGDLMDTAYQADQRSAQLVREFLENKGKQAELRVFLSSSARLQAFSGRAQDIDAPAAYRRSHAIDTQLRQPRRRARGFTWTMGGRTGVDRELWRARADPVAGP